VEVNPARQSAHSVHQSYAIQNHNI
jgi:hypothetical protein